MPLSSRRGSSGDNFTGTTFDDSATTPISSGTAPFSGSFKPETPLAALNGIAANGTWKLEVNDAASGDTGTLTAWSIQLTTSGNPSCLSCAPIQVAGEATNLHFLSGSKTDMEWSAALFATSYNLYRGVAAQLPALLTAGDRFVQQALRGGHLDGKRDHRSALLRGHLLVPGARPERHGRRPGRQRDGGTPRAEQLGGLSVD